MRKDRQPLKQSCTACTSTECYKDSYQSTRRLIVVLEQLHIIFMHTIPPENIEVWSPGEIVIIFIAQGLICV
jgi:hypothetical protein